MLTHEIPVDDWIDFANRFSKSHVGWPVTIQILSDDPHPKRIADHLPFLGLSFDTKGTRPSSLEVSVGQQDSLISHSVDLPLHIRQAELPPGDSGVIEIEPAQGPQVLIEYHRP